MLALHTKLPPDCRVSETFEDRSISGSRTRTKYTYDQNGNTLTKADASGTTQYAWDIENRLSTVTLPAGGGTVSFKYDPFGRRIEKATASGTTIYAYDGANFIAEYDAAGVLLAKYAQGAGIDEPLAMSRGGQVGYYDADGLGSVTSVIDNTLTPLATYTYDAFGKKVTSGGNLINPFQYTGREWDQETGLYYYRARYYNPQAGRFLSEDPLGFDAGVNFFTYLGNDPVDLTDPMGLCPDDKEKKKRCRLTLNLNYAFALSPVVQQHVVSTLNSLFGPDIELDISTANPSADLNILVGIIPTMTSGEMGEVPMFNGAPANYGTVDLGQIVFLQGFHHASQAALGNAIGNVVGHELGHELYLPHSQIGGLMSPAVDPFTHPGFTDTNLINILNRCLYLRRTRGH